MKGQDARPDVALTKGCTFHCAVVRYARTDKAHVSICALLPQLGSATELDHWAMLNLPVEGEINMAPHEASKNDEV
jgi:hypothetical protein